jgi:hypothetical protein
MYRFGILALSTLATLHAQTICPATPTYSICDIILPAVAPLEVRGEFRSPSHHTYLIPAFWDGSRMILRVTPTESGSWDFRLSDGKQGQFTATASDAPGFIEGANVHHFRYTGNREPHLWMGQILPSLEGAQFEPYVRQRASQKFNHLRLTLLPSREAFPDADHPNTAWFADLDSRILLLNRLGITADLAIAPGNNAFTQWFPEHDQRERVVRYLVARYGAMNITWQGLENFETYDKGRELLQEIGGYLRTMDQYHHLQSCGTLATSGPLFHDGWMNVLNFRSPDGQIAAIEHQIYPTPNLNDFGSGAAASDFQYRLWSSGMDGQYPETTVPENVQAGNIAKIWYEFFAGTRHWELEPFFDVENGKGLALEGIEYIIYIRTPGPVSVQVEKHSYDVEWFNPSTGETLKVKKNLKDETFSGETPDNTHDWVLHISREGQKSSMLKSYKFESREVLMQEVESNPAKVPFTIAQPSLDTLSLASPGAYAAKVTKETRGTRRMQYLWTGEVTADEQSYRVIGTGAQGTLQIPANIVSRFPALLHVHVTAMNANGKVYALDRNYQLTK